MTLTDFLLARIAEDEAAARAAIGRTEVNEFGEMLNFDMWHQQDWIEIGGAQLAHVRRHDPARVLAECEANRRIVRTCTAELAGRDVQGAQMDGDDGPWLAEQTVRALASVYADHPDYREEWGL